MMIDGKPFEAVVKATRVPGGTEASPHKQVLAELLGGLDIPTEGWSITTTGGDTAIRINNCLTTGALAAVLRAAGVAPTPKPENEPLMTGLWLTGELRDLTQATTRQGFATLARWAAETDRTILTAADGPCEYMLPRNRRVQYWAAKTRAEFIDILTGMSPVQSHRPRKPNTTSGEAEHVPHPRGGIWGAKDQSTLETVLELVEEAIADRRPLLITVDPTLELDYPSITAGYTGQTAADLLNAVRPEPNPDDQQEILEVHNACGLIPPPESYIRPLGHLIPIQRPVRHPTQGMSIEEVTGQPDLPGELDLAAHGTLVVDMRAEKRPNPAIRNAICRPLEEQPRALPTGRRIQRTNTACRANADGERRLGPACSTP